MHVAHLVPSLALARVVTAGGPYRPGDELSLAFTTPTVGRLVAHDAELRARCVPLERALVPETIAVVITHCAEPFTPGEIVTLSFVDARVARIHDSRENLERQARSLVPESAGETAALDRVAEPAAAERIAQSASDARVAKSTPAHEPDERATAMLASHARPSADVRADERLATTTPREPRLVASAFAASERTLTANEVGISYSSNAVPAQIHAGERMTLEEPRAADDARGDSTARHAATLDASPHDGEPTPRTHARRGVTVRLEWNAERVRRFVQVVDKLFTIDRLGWYRHSLAMRLLVPDEIACGDTLANVEAMRHLQALRAAAVESLGKPLLAACMPGFAISSEWLESIESSREARAIAGLREALSPYADDGEEPGETPSAQAHSTIGTISRTELLAENATSVEAFLPVLIPTTAHDAALGVRLAEYRRLLIELFAQTARAGEPVRLQQMAQPNHSLDDRLWQLVGAAAEAFGGFAHA